jgi:hypothetical protein
MARVGIPGLLAIEVDDDWPLQPLEGAPGFQAALGPDVHLGVSFLPIPTGVVAPIDQLRDVLEGTGSQPRVEQEYDHPAGCKAALVEAEPRPDQRLHAHVVQGEKLAILASLVGPWAAVAGLRSAFEALVSSVRFDGPEVHEPGALARRLQAELEAAYPRFTFRIVDTDLIEAVDPARPGDVHELGLSSLERRLANAPDDRDRLIADHVRDLRLDEAEPVPGSIALDRLFPRLARRERLASAARPGFAGPVTRPFPHDEALVVALVASHERGDRYLLDADLTALELDFEAALDRARANLAERLKATPLEAIRAPDGATRLVVISKHFHAHAALLLPSLGQVLGDALGCTEFHVCVPAMDELVAIRGDDPKLLSATVAKARGSYRTDPYPVSDRVFVVSKAGELRVAEV